MSKYLVTFNRSSNVGIEEYDGGNTLEEARKEARFFCENLPTHVRVSICAVSSGSCRLVLKEVVREGSFS